MRSPDAKTLLGRWHGPDAPPPWAVCAALKPRRRSSGARIGIAEGFWRCLKPYRATLAQHLQPEAEPAVWLRKISR